MLFPPFTARHQGECGQCNVLEWSISTQRHSTKLPRTHSRYTSVVLPSTASANATAPTSPIRLAPSLTRDRKEPGGAGIFTNTVPSDCFTAITIRLCAPPLHFFCRVVCDDTSTYDNTSRLLWLQAKHFSNEIVRIVRWDIGHRMRSSCYADAVRVQHCLANGTWRTYYRPCSLG